MGVTTKVGDNCGDSYNRLEDFCGRVNSQGSPTNYMMFVGQNSLRQHAGADTGANNLRKCSLTR